MGIRKKWHAHYPEETPTSIEYDEKPLHAYLEETASRFPEKKALYFQGKEMTFAELHTEAKKLANYLQSIGLEKDDKVAIMLPNCPQAVISYYGILMAGGIVVQTNPLYTERELEYQVNDSDAKIIICLDILVPRVSKVQEKTDLECKIVTGIKDYLPFPKNLIYPFIQKREYNMVVKVENSGDTHVWQKIKQRSRIIKKWKSTRKRILPCCNILGVRRGFQKGSCSLTSTWSPICKCVRLGCIKRNLGKKSFLQSYHFSMYTV